MSVVVNLTLKAKPERYDALRELMAEILPHTVARAGNELVSCMTDINAQTIVVHGVWESTESQEDYLAWLTERGDFERVTSMLSQAPRIEHMTHVQIG